MTLGVGSRLGPYEVTAKLGEGGMGEVWRATDSRLQREVAIKVLPAAFTADRERLIRFEREAQLLAQIHHPNVAAIHGIEDAEGTRALVMELVQGDELSVLLSRGPLAIADALPIARQIAEALEAAHERGIVHRDLKPANIKVSPDGTVKVLDFGLAKAAGPESSGARELSNSPTLAAAPHTGDGVILGTAAYMAPEQARGAVVDKRADVWAFGVVLHEMLAGQRLFAGDSVADTLANVLHREVDLAALPATVPAPIRALLRRCLERNPKNRLRDIGDARLILDEVMAAPAERSGGPGSPAGAPARRMAAVPWIVAGAAVAFAAWAAIPRTSGKATTAPVELTRLEISLPAGVEAASGLSGGFAISPDGRRVAMIGVRDGQRRLYVRRLDHAAATEITASSGVNTAAFSPDGAAIVFVPGSAEVTRVTLADQQRAVVAPGADLSSTVAWGPTGIYFHRGGALWMVAAGGGAPRQLATLDASRGEVQHADPLEVPGGLVLFTSMASATESARIDAVALEGGARTVVVERATSPGWAGSRHLLFERDGGIWAAAFDPSSGPKAGPAVAILPPGEIGYPRFGGSGYRLASNGTLLAMPPGFAESRLVAVSRAGVERAFDLPSGGFAGPRLSPDGTRLLLDRDSSVLEVVELQRGTRTQLTSPAFGTSFGSWSGDGAMVVCRRFNLPHWIAADSSGRSGRIAGLSINDYPTAPGPDADTVLSVRVQENTGGDLLLTSISGRFPPRAILETPAYEGGPQLSPDGRWLLYQSNAAGRPEIFVRAYPALDRVWQVSEGGGVQTHWSADGREVYYRSGQRMMAAAFDGRGEAPVLARPVALFADVYELGQGLSIPNYDVTPDGQFLMLRRLPSGGRLHVVLGWSAELERLLAAKSAR
jgi:hypothetical protein